MKIVHVLQVPYSRALGGLEYEKGGVIGCAVGHRSFDEVKMEVGGVVGVVIVIVITIFPPTVRDGQRHRAKTV